MTSSAAHWHTLWRDRSEGDVGWYQDRPRCSLELIAEVGLDRDAPIIDVGGGASRLVDALLADGYRDVTVLDIAAASLDRARRRLGARADDVAWVEADVLATAFTRRYALWHDRAVFHFLTDPVQRERYVRQVAGAVDPGGWLVVATFAPHGPETCSGLPVQRHGPDELTATFGDAFVPERFVHEDHVTPQGAVQAYVYGRFRRQA